VLGLETPVARLRETRVRLPALFGSRAPQGRMTNQEMSTPAADALPFAPISCGGGTGPVAPGFLAGSWEASPTRLRDAMSRKQFRTSAAEPHVARRRQHAPLGSRAPLGRAANRKADSPTTSARFGVPSVGKSVAGQTAMRLPAGLEVALATEP